MNLNPDFIDSMRPLLGERTADFISALEASPEVAVRLNPRKSTGRQLFEGEPVGWCDTGLYLHGRPVFTLMPQMHGGAFYVQDASSMIYKHIFRHIIKLTGSYGCPARVLDMCAAPGGKTTAIIDALDTDTVVVANEYVGKRASVLAENLAKWGHPHCIVTNSDTSAFADTSRFDIVAVDAPCSGEGMMRKDEEAVAQWSPSLVADCARLQRKILDDAVAALLPGGYLVYSTCTFNLAENEENVAYLVDNHGFEPVNIPVEPSWGIIPPLVGDNPCMRFMQHSTRGEGLFAAVLRKPEDDVLSAPGRLKHSQRFTASKEWAHVREWLNPATDWHIRGRKGEIYAFPEAVEEMERSLGREVRIISAGVPVGSTKGRDLVPAPELALSLDLRQEAFPDATLGEAGALSYLRREATALPGEFRKGYMTVSHDGLRLGFVKNIGSRANNLYPQQWRIRMQAK